MGGFRVIAVLAVCGAMLWTGIARADGQGGDSVQAALDNAKSARSSAINSANATLLAAFEAQIKAAADADAGKVLATQKAAFASAGTLPDSPFMQDAVNQYQQAIKAANATLVDAYGSAIRDYTEAGNFDKSEALHHEQQALEQGLLQTSDPTLSSTTPKGIAAQLDLGKQSFKQAMDAAKREMLSEIDQSIDAATRAGDLTAVETLQKARATAAVDGSIPDDVKDPAVMAAHKHYLAAVRAANDQLALAYQKAVKDYTRAQDLNDARDTQNELASLGTGSKADVGSLEGTYRLSSELPDFLTSKDSVFAALPKRWGILVPEESYIRTKAGNFLGKDFTCDVWFYMIKDLKDMHDRSIKQMPALVGIGAGTINITNEGPLDALYLEINPPDQSKGEVVLHKRQASNKITIGHLKDFDTYIARIQKSGDLVTFAVGTEENGNFVQAMSTTVSLQDAGAFLNDSNAHLFFGNGVFEQIRIGAGPPPVVATATVATNKTATVAPTPTPAPAPAPAPTTQPAAGGVATVQHFSGWYRIKNKGSGQYLWITSANKNQGNVAEMRRGNNTESEQWVLDQVAGCDAVRITNKYSNRCIGVREGKADAGMDIIEWSPRNVDDKAGANPPVAPRYWRIEAVGDSFKIVNQLTDQCLTCQKSQNVKVVQEPWDGSDASFGRSKP